MCDMMVSIAEYLCSLFIVQWQLCYFVVRALVSLKVI